jgi:hypothetical protein
VILVDTNILLDAGVKQAARHERARQWLDEQISSGSRVGMPWHSLLGFVRLASNPVVSPHTASVAVAWRTVRAWLGASNVWIPEPTERHADVIDGLIGFGPTSSRAVMDVHLAALAIEHDLTLCSADKGFARYRDLKWLNPFAP